MVSHQIEKRVKNMDAELLELDTTIARKRDELRLLELGRENKALGSCDIFYPLFADCPLR